MKIKKLLVFLFMFFLFSSVVLSCVNASVISQFTGSKNNDVDKVSQTVIQTVLAYVRYGSAVVAVAILLYIGTKYMTAAGGDRADIKKYAMNYVVGALIMFAASGIIDIIRKIISTS